METLSLSVREENTGKEIVAHFKFAELEWLGIVERADTTKGFRFTKLGKELLRTYTHPLEFAEAIRCVGYNKVHSSKPPSEFVGDPIRKH